MSLSVSFCCLFFAGALFFLKTAFFFLSLMHETNIIPTIASAVNQA